MISCCCSASCSAEAAKRKSYSEMYMNNSGGLGGSSLWGTWRWAGGAYPPLCDACTSRHPGTSLDSEHVYLHLPPFCSTVRHSHIL
jgi:hypothetical protein